jgi:serine/threonine-protein kinase
MTTDQRQSWWQTLPGILTAFAGVLTAATGLYIAVVQNRGDSPRSAPPVVANANVTRPSAGGGAAPSAPGAAADEKASLPPPKSQGRGATPKAWAETDALLTMTDGSETTVRAESLANCISVSHSIALSTGQDIPFERMRALDVVRSDATGTPNARATIDVTLLDGRTVKGMIDAGCGWFGYNDMGRFDFNVDRLRRVAFSR